jgi:hypothetical protein
MPSKGTGFACEVPFDLVAVVVSDVCQGRDASRGVVIGPRFCPLRYLPMEYRIVKWVLTRQCLPPGKVIMLFRRVPQA